MNIFRVLPGFRRTPAGLERAVLRRLPVIAVLGTVLPILAGIAAWRFASPVDATLAARSLTRIEIIVASIVALHWTAVLTVGIACVVVMVMKGPAYVADGYEVPDADAPARGDSPPRDAS
jgi:hypothetical protein